MATGRKPFLSVGSAIGLLTSTMRDPMKASACALRISLAADRIDQELEECTSMAAKIEFAKSHPEFLRAGIKFLTFPQGIPEYEATIARLTRCRCDFGQPGMERRHRAFRPRQDERTTLSGVELIFDAVATVSNCLVLALADLTQQKFRNARATGEQPWPQGPEDLLPYGPEDSLLGLENWVSAPPLGYIIFKLAGSLAIFYVPFAKEVLRSPFTFCFAAPIEHLSEAIKFYDDHGWDSLPLARTHLFTYPVKTIFEFFDTLRQCDAAQFNTIVGRRGSWISSVLARLTTILPTLPMDWSKIRRAVRFMAIFANTEYDPATGVGVITLEPEQFIEFAAPFSDGLEKAFKEIIEVRKMGCWNTTCSSGAEIIHSRLCGKCNLLRYCGEKCQKEAWKSPVLPHKPLCAEIHRLKESLGTEDWLLMWTPDYTYAQFLAMSNAKKIDPEAVKAIGRTIYALRRRKNEELIKAGESEEMRLLRVKQEKASAQMVESLIDPTGLTPQKIIRRDDYLRKAIQ
ncbi:hypothetical protein GALMADRAFT_223461 [Galerina marginata CBS 339.88]|uniref:MYND-type domain-containing protein n=1 Tax=Galerina marginata (strain CBS 339.88) TaxID=685588 RepID=A0A067T7U7_GALM3|nr:hypothetical protein GALMADRAFT_223461 [Galerina marginata CBS 339.88]